MFKLLVTKKKESFACEPRTDVLVEKAFPSAEFVRVDAGRQQSFQQETQICHWRKSLSLKSQLTAKGEAGACMCVVQGFLKINAASKSAFPVLVPSPTLETHFKEKENQKKKNCHFLSSVSGQNTSTCRPS